MKANEPISSLAHVRDAVAVIRDRQHLRRATPSSAAECPRARAKICGCHKPSGEVLGAVVCDRKGRKARSYAESGARGASSLSTA